MSHVFDEALERLRGTGTEVAGRGAPNHGPMAAEALNALGGESIVVGWRTDTARSSRRCPRRPHL
jgi:hypothetical protein